MHKNKLFKNSPSYGYIFTPEGWTDGWRNTAEIFDLDLGLYAMSRAELNGHLSELFHALYNIVRKDTGNTFTPTRTSVALHLTKRAEFNEFREKVTEKVHAIFTSGKNPKLRGSYAEKFPESYVYQFMVYAVQTTFANEADAILNQLFIDDYNRYSEFDAERLAIFDVAFTHTSDEANDVSFTKTLGKIGYILESAMSWLVMLLIPYYARLEREGGLPSFLYGPVDTAAQQAAREANQQAAQQAAQKAATEAANLLAALDELGELGDVAPRKNPRRNTRRNPISESSSGHPKMTVLPMYLEDHHDFVTLNRAMSALEREVIIKTLAFINSTVVVNNTMNIPGYTKGLEFSMVPFCKAVIQNGVYSRHTDKIEPDYKERQKQVKIALLQYITDSTSIWNRNKFTTECVSYVIQYLWAVYELAGEGTIEDAVAADEVPSMASGKITGSAAVCEFLDKIKQIKSRFATPQPAKDTVIKTEFTLLVDHLMPLFDVWVRTGKYPPVWAFKSFDEAVQANDANYYPNPYTSYTLVEAKNGGLRKMYDDATPRVYYDLFDDVRDRINNDVKDMQTMGTVDKILGPEDFDEVVGDWLLRDVLEEAIESYPLEDELLVNAAEYGWFISSYGAYMSRKALQAQVEVARMNKELEDSRDENGVYTAKISSRALADLMLEPMREWIKIAWEDACKGVDKETEPPVESDDLRLRSVQLLAMNRFATSQFEERISYDARAAQEAARRAEQQQKEVQKSAVETANLLAALDELDEFDD